MRRDEISVTWLGLTATYTADEREMMAALKAKGKVGEMEMIHTLKAVLGARPVPS